MKTKISKVWVDNSAVYVQTNGQTFSRVFSDFPLLKNATEKQRADFQVGKYGIRWDSIDEDLSYNGFFNPVKNIYWQ
ncbi:MAG: DUF2442 domain-containing protein [Prevotellaceae bacterium]|jgi:hypothetical protein|nr:DUF2442 domain-containing protein [Prevotellaceae bacterium]